MKYKVHRIDVNKTNMQDKIEVFLNELAGELITVIPHITPIFRGMGATSTVDYVLVIEKQ